jgi:hypothetical protein
MYHSLALQLGALGSPPVVLGVLLVLAAIIVVGRLLLSLAWRLVVIAIVVVGALYLLSLVGVSVGVF